MARRTDLPIGQLTRLAREHGLRVELVGQRLSRGWTLQRALETPAGPPPPRAQRITIGDVTLSVRGWSRRTGLPPSTLARRLAAGWPLELALTDPPDPRPRSAR